MTAFFGHSEWIIILVVVLLLFGHRIPGMARSLGSGIIEFKKGLKGAKEDEHEKLPAPPGTGQSSTQQPSSQRTTP